MWSHCRASALFLSRRAIERLVTPPHPSLLLETLTLAPASLIDRGGDGGRYYSSASPASCPSLSIWRRKKEMGKEGLFVVHQLKRLGSGPRLERFMKSHVSRLLRTDLLAVLAEFQRQDLVFLAMKVISYRCTKMSMRERYATLSQISLDVYGQHHHLMKRIYDSVRKEIWYRPDMYFYRDMLMMHARNKKDEEARKVWADLRSEGVLFDQHTYGDIVRAFLDGGLPSLAMEFYDEMRQSPDPPLSLPFRVMLKGLIPYPETREKVKVEFLELFPDMIVYDPPEDLFDDHDDILRTKYHIPGDDMTGGDGCRAAIEEMITEKVPWR